MISQYRGFFDIAAYTPKPCQNEKIVCCTIDDRFIMLFSNQIEMIKNVNMNDKNDSDALHIILLFVCENAHKSFDVKWTPYKRIEKLNFNKQLGRYSILVTADLQTVTALSALFFFLIYFQKKQKKTISNTIGNCFSLTNT